MIEIPQNIYAIIYRTSRKNAATRGIEFDLTIDEFFSLVKKANGRCTVTGLEFTDLWKWSEKCSRRPFMPSLDRIDSQKGYTLKNCRMVCVIVNLALSDWGIVPFIMMNEAFIEKQYKISFGEVVRLKEMKKRMDKKEQEARDHRKRPLPDNLADSYFTASEYLKEHNLGIKAGMLSKAAQSLSTATNIDTYMKPIFAYHRVDGSAAYILQRSFSKEILSEAASRILAKNEQKPLASVASGVDE